MRMNHVTRAILDRHGEINQYDLGDALGVAQPTVSLALAGLRRNPELQERIAAHFGFKPRDLWGSLYNPAGRRVMPRRSRSGHGRLLSGGGARATKHRAARVAG